MGGRASTVVGPRRADVLPRVAARRLPPDEWHARHFGKFEATRVRTYKSQMGRAKLLDYRLFLPYNHAIAL